MAILENFLATHEWYDLALLAFAAVLMPVMSVFAGRQMAREALGSLVPRYWFTAARGWLAAGAVLFAWYWSGRYFTRLGLDMPINIRGQVGFLAVALIVAFTIFQLMRLRKISAKALERSLVTIKRLKIVPRTRAELTVFMLVAVTAGVWEELLYRGFLMWLFMPAAGPWGAVAISSALFGIGHAYQGWRGVLMTGTVGLVFAVLFLFSGSLWWLMAAHAMIDIYGGLVTFQLSRLAQARNSPNGEALG